MNDPKLNETYCRAVAAWATPNDRHDLKACSTEYAVRQLDKAAGSSPGSCRTELLNDHTVEGKVQKLGKLHGFKSLLNLSPFPTTDDLKWLIRICYNLPRFKFPEYEKYENEVLSDEEANEIAPILVGRLCQFLGFNVPQNPWPDTPTLCNDLRLFYTIADERSTPARGFFPPPISVNHLPPAPPYKQVSQDTDTSPSLLSYEKRQQPNALKRVLYRIKRSIFCGAREGHDDSESIPAC
ncbi:hypothetical protein MGU_09486 [Metarhizium guizhouense ARSEF 977]|uniref:Uncharacterized protein n=1 Tax=Metarhizium guizhouense (strain ARSEF 977) TaxID=1276136 RepID=A0A0B4G920_METGA|nr:hypothetical protein MGU_09486 [Metarhizium guizhouense ARSEF 977]